MARWEYFWSEGYHCCEYYYEHGQIPRLPTREQFHAACRFRRLGRVLRTAGGPFLRRLFSKSAFRTAGATASNPKEVKAEATIYRFQKGAEASDAESAEDAGTRLAGLSGVDRLLARINEIDVLRAILVECVTPETLFAGLGFRIWSSTRCNHLLLAPHPCEKAVWDIQLLQADPGGFELLERRVEEAREARTLRGKVLRTLGTRRLSGAHRFELVRQTDPETGEVRYVDAKMVDSGEVVLSERDWQRWYDHVLDTIDRARRFDYLVREQDNPLQPYPAPTVIRFLRFAALIEPKHFAFFKNRDLQEAHPEIHWPPDRA